MKNLRSLPWITFPANTKTAFPPATIQRLASRHGFQEDNILSLGMDLLVAMSLGSHQLDDRQLAVQRRNGEKRRKRAINHIRRAEAELESARDAVSDLTVANANSLGIFDRNPVSWAARLDKAASDLAHLRSALEYSAQLERAIADPTAHDRRLDRDDVRINVLKVVFLFWREQGRPLSLTTRPDVIQEPVTGPLVEFARDVVAELTVPSNTLSSDTLKADLRNVRNLLDEFDAALPLFPPKTL